MLGTFCFFLLILYFLATYYRILHYLVTLTILINILLIIIWINKLPFKQVFKKIIFGQIFWSFMWILWIFNYPNVFIFKKYYGYLSQQLINNTGSASTTININNINNEKSSLNIENNENIILQNNRNQHLNSRLILQQQNAHSNNIEKMLPNYHLALVLIPLLFHLPMMISNLGKLYMLCSPPNRIDRSLLQEIILFQSKLQLGIFFYCILQILLNIFMPDIGMIISVIGLGIILKAKYNAHFGTQKAYRQLHFAFDKMFKVLGLRSFYQSLYKLMSFGFLNLIQLKQISY